MPARPVGHNRHDAGGNHPEPRKAPHYPRGRDLVIRYLARRNNHDNRDKSLSAASQSQPREPVEHDRKRDAHDGRLPAGVFQIGDPAKAFDKGRDIQPDRRIRKGDSPGAVEGYACRKNESLRSNLLAHQAKQPAIAYR